MSITFSARERAARSRAALAAPVAPDAGEDYGDVDIAIVCESTYPYLTGGLSAVVHQICEAHPGLRIGIIHLTWDSNSPTVDRYGVPPQVAWVMPVYQSLSEHKHTFGAFGPGDSGLPKRAWRALAQRVVSALQAHLDGSDEELWALYDDGVNPLTRTFRLWPVLTQQPFMEEITRFLAGSGLSFTDLFWHLREFASLTYAATDRVWPKADVYHSHTTGAASILAAAAARQHDSRFLLTEHNLYVRDTINHGLERSMETVVTLDEWRTLDVYPVSGAEPGVGRVTPSQRAWNAYWTRSGVVAYRAADHITYLYPEAIEEARGLGGDPSKSTVLPNGITPSHFDDARAHFESRLVARLSEPRESRIWRFAYAARIVPIKGLLDLLESMALLLEDGFTRWQLDVMGPDGEAPWYVERCRARCTELGLDAHVKFLGSVNLRERFGHYDVLVIPSHNEGQPIVILEAMTIGLPTIGTYVGGNRELVEDVLHAGDLQLGRCGALTQPRDITGFAEKLLDLVALPDEMLRELTQQARERVARRFHIDNAMAMYGDLYFRLAASTAPLGGAFIAPSPTAVATEPVAVAQVETTHLDPARVETPLAV